MPDALSTLRQLADGPSGFRSLRARGGVAMDNLPFRAIVSVLDTWQGPGLDEAYALLEEKIRAWPAHARLAPWSFCAGLTDEDPKPYWAWVAERQSHPHVFFHDCYRPPHDTIIALPATAQARLEKLPHIQTILRQPPSADSFHLSDRWTAKSFRKEISKKKYDDLKHLYLESPPGYLPREAEHILAVLAETGHLSRLETLVMDGYHASMTVEGVHTLCEADPARLETLSLNFCSIHEDSVEAVALLAEANFPSLNGLGLAGFGLTDGDLEQIAGSSWFTRLENLDLSNNELTAIGKLPRLRQLNLSRNEFSVDMLSSLALSGALDSLWSLSVDMADERFVRAVAQSGMSQLVELVSWEEYNPDSSKTYDAETARILAESPTLGRADVLFIGYVDWSDACDGHGPIPRACLDTDGVERIRRSTTLRAASRQELTLLNTGFDDVDD
jgi:hypothetical protein